MKVRMAAIPVAIGAWCPVWFGWWDGADFAVAATSIVVMLAATRNIQWL